MNGPIGCYFISLTPLHSCFKTVHFRGPLLSQMFKYLPDVQPIFVLVS